jgi:hypothetical protein
MALFELLVDIFAKGLSRLIYAMNDAFWYMVPLLHPYSLLKGLNMLIRIILPLVIAAPLALGLMHFCRSRAGKTVRYIACCGCVSIRAIFTLLTMMSVCMAELYLHDAFTVLGVIACAIVSTLVWRSFPGSPSSASDDTGSARTGGGVAGRRPRREKLR